MSVRPTVRALILTAACVAALSACNRDDERRPVPPAKGDQAVGVTPADAAAPMAYESKNQFATVKLTLPDVVKAQPDLHAQLYSTRVRDLRGFVEGAQADRTEAGGDQGQPPYEKTITLTAAAQTGKLVSLKQTAFDFSGGAHPNTLYTAVLWDKALKRVVQPADLFRKGADLVALDQALCAAMNTAKRGRDPSAEPITLNTDKMFYCPRASQTPFVLTPGDTSGKAGGMTFLVGTYQAGPYSEGAYEIALPQSVFRTLIAPAYADEFVGAPAKTGDITPTAG